MSKSSKSRRKYQRRPVPVRPISPRPTTSPAAKASPSVSAEDQAARAQANLADEYRYVLGDLKTMGILAASMFTLLVVLAVILG